MFLKEDSQSKLHFLDEKIRSLYHSLSHLRPSISLPKSQIFDGIEFPLDPDEQSNYRSELLSSICKSPSLKTVFSYPSLLLSEYQVLKPLPSDLLEALKRILNEEQEDLKTQAIKTLQSSKKKTRSDVPYELDPLMNETSSLLAKVNSTKDANFGSFLEIVDIIKILRIGIEKFRLLYPCIELCYTLSWLGLSHKSKIHKEFAKSLKSIKARSISRMKLLTSDPNIGKVNIKVKIVTNINARNIQRQREMMKRFNALHSTFAEEQFGVNTEILNSYLSDFDLPPVLISTPLQLNTILKDICNEFGLLSTLEEDDGLTITHQITYLFPEVFEIQKQKSEFIPYADPIAKDLQKKKIQKLPNKITKNFANIRKTSLIQEEENKKVVYKIVCIKEHDWKSQINPSRYDWEKVQESRIRSILKSDALLENSFNILSIQNFNALIKLIEEFSVIYQEKTNKKGRLRHELGETQNEVRQNYLKGLLSDKASSHVTEFESIPLSSQNLKSIYTLKLLKSRELKFKIIQILNVFKCYEKRLNNDLLDFQKIRLCFEKSKFESKIDSVEKIDNEYYVKDTNDEYIIYDCTFEEYKNLEDWLLHLGTFYIEKHELILDHNSNQYPPIDREFLMGELLEEEYKFLHSKLQLIMILFRFYNSCVSIEFLLNISEFIMQVIQMRPRLNLTNSYFTQSYWAHCEALNTQCIFFTTFGNIFLKKDLKKNISLTKVTKINKMVSKIVDDLCLDLQIICPKEISLLECIVWQEAQIRIIECPGNELIEEKGIDWEVLADATKSSIEDVLRGKITNLEGNQISYTDLCLNIFDFFLNYKALLKLKLKCKVLKRIYEIQLKTAEKEQINSFEPFVLKNIPKSSEYFHIFEIIPDLSKVIDFKSKTDLQRIITGQSLGLVKLIQKYELWNSQFYEVALQVNTIIMEKYIKTITELEIALEENFIMKGSKVNWIMILGRKGEGIIAEKVQQEVKRLKNKVNAAHGFVDVMALKFDRRQKLTNIEGTSPQDIVNSFCDEIREELFKKAQVCQILKVVKEIWKIVSIVPEQFLEKLLAKGNKKTNVCVKHYNLDTLRNLENLMMNFLNKPDQNNLDLSAIFFQILSFERYLQLEIMLKLLGSNRLSVLELYELSTITKPVDPEDQEDSVPDELKDNQEIKKMISYFSDLISLKTTDWSSNFSRLFYRFSNALYDLKDKLLTENNEAEVRILQGICEEIFGFRAFSQIPESSSLSIIHICQRFRSNHHVEKFRLSGGFVPSFHLGLVDLSDQSRRFIFNNFNQSDSSETSLVSIENQLLTQILKSLFIVYKASQTHNTINYNDCLQLYNDYLEDLQESPEICSAQIITLKQFFQEEICIFGIKTLENLFKSYNPRFTIPSNSMFSCNFEHFENDSSSKVGCIQNFINFVRNKSSRVETSTSGYALVVYVRDFSYAIQKLMNGLLVFNQSYFFSQIETLKLRMEFLKKKLENTEILADYFSGQAEKIVRNFDGIVNLTVTQRGGEIIYDLDSIRRQLKEIQENTKQLEACTRIIVDSEFRERLETKDREIRDLEKNFRSFQEEVAQNLKNDLENNISNGIEAIIPFSSKLKRVKIQSIYHETRESVKERRKNEKKKMQNQLTSLRIFHKWATVHQKEKIDKEVSKLKHQLTSNQIIWEELNHSQRRETILKQELANAQTILSTSEKNIEKLQKEIEEINSERLRLQMFKDNKVKQTEILEQFLKSEKESKSKQESLKQMLENNQKIKNLQEKELLAAQQFLPNLENYEIDVKRLKAQLHQVRNAKDEAFERLESIRREVETRSQKIDWKEKFINLTRNMTNSTSKSFVYSTSRTPIKLNDSLNYLSSKSKSPTLPKISDRVHRL